MPATATTAPVQAADQYIPGIAGGAAYCHMSQRTFAQLVKSKKIPVIRTGGKKLLFDKADLDAYLQSCKS